MFAQSLIGAVGPVIVFVGGFIGLQLAPSESLATLPVACMIIGIAGFMLPAIKVLTITGRKKGFILAVSVGVINACFTAYTIYLQSFWLFCLAIALFGFTIATVQQFRFAAMESVDDDKGSNAVSALLIAGLLAAFIGPEIAFVGKDWFATEFVGSFVGVAVLLALSLFLLVFYQQIDKHHSEEKSTARELKEIIAQPVFKASIISATVGFAVMSFIMTATPISMHVFSGFDIAETKWVIQSHIIAMYLPSFFTGALIRRFGASVILYAGVLALLTCIIIGYAGQHYVHYWGALVMLGIGWNFMFITATALLPMSYNSSEKFRVQGFNDVVMFSCQALASLSAGWVITSFGWNIMLSLSLPLLALATFYIYSWQKNNNKNKE
jgi:MFS family permease